MPGGSIRTSANMANLEQQFKRAVKKANEQIEEHLNKAIAELAEAVKVSEELGIPFNSNISFLTQSYKPKSFDEKWDKLNEHCLDEQIDFTLPEWDGWEYSRVCYG